MGKVYDSQNLPPALQALTSSMDDCITHLREQEAKLKEENEALKDRINKLEVDIGDWEMSDANKDDEMEQMRESIIEDLKEKDNKIKELEKTIEDHNDMVEAYDAVDCERLGAEEKIRELNEEIDELRAKGNKSGLKNVLAIKTTVLKLMAKECVAEYKRLYKE